MKHAFRIVLLLLGVGLVQTTLGQIAPPFGAVDGLMIAAGLLALRLPFQPAVMTGAFAGLVQDSLGGGIIGLHAFAKTAVMAVLASMGTVVVVRGQLAEAVVIGIATVAEGVIVRGMLIFLDWPTADTTAAIISRGLATGATCGIITILAPRAVVGWQRWRRRSRMSLR